MKEELYSLESSNNDDDDFRPEYLEEEMLRPTVTVKLKEIEFQDIYMMKQVLPLTKKKENLLQVITKLKIQYLMSVQGILNKLFSMILNKFF